MTTTHTINVKKAGRAFDVDFQSLPEASRAHVIAYGLRQLLNDAAAGTEAGDESVEAVDKRLANLVAGTLRASVGRTADPVAKRAKEIAIALLRQGKVKIAGKPSTAAHAKDAALVAKVAESDKVRTRASVDVKAAAGLDIEV